MIIISAMGNYTIAKSICQLKKIIKSQNINIKQLYYIHKTA